MPIHKTLTTATEMLPAVRAILFKARKKRGEYAFLTAHQILAVLREAKALIEERGRAGGGEGKTYGASSLLTRALRMLVKRQEVEVTFLDTRSLQIRVPAQDGLVNPAGTTLGLYRRKKT